MSASYFRPFAIFVPKIGRFAGSLT